MIEKMLYFPLKTECKHFSINYKTDDVIEQFNNATETTQSSSIVPQEIREREGLPTFIGALIPSQIQQEWHVTVMETQSEERQDCLDAVLDFLR